jgi:group II intron reverse transcriptase/maturase
VLKVPQNVKGTVIRNKNFCTMASASERQKISNSLRRLTKNSMNKDIVSVNHEVQYLLNNPIFYVHCYEAISSNSGAIAQGLDININPSKTLDGINFNFFDKIAKSVGSGTFQFGPIKRTTVLRKGISGGTRPLGIASSRDKIVQKAIAVLLETVSEPHFYECSFGFRRGKSAHDAIHFIKTKVPSGSWVIEGDISKCFDSFNHKRLVSIIKKNYISNQTFIDLVYKSIKAKVVNVSSTTVQKSGIAQGSVVSPILSNIYLHELDTFIAESNLLSEFKGTAKATTNPSYTKAIQLSNAEIEDVKAKYRYKQKKKYWKILHKLRKQKLLKADKAGIPTRLRRGNVRKMLYLRYADDFIIFVWGSKSDCDAIKCKVNQFLNSELDFTLSGIKTRIININEKKANFLGFQIWQSPKILTTRRDLNPAGKKCKKTNLKLRGAVFSRRRVRITFSINQVLRKLVDNGMVRFTKDGKFRPTSYKSALSIPIPNIVKYLRSVFIGIANYYQTSDNWYDCKSLVNYYGKYCTAMTIGHKTKSRIGSVFKKYGDNLCVTNSDNNIVAKWDKWDSIPLTERVKIKWKSDNPGLFKNVEILIKSNLKLGRISLIFEPCVICGSTLNVEIHHIKSARLAQKNTKVNSLKSWVNEKRLDNRNRIPLCSFHHRIVHIGEYQGKNLKNYVKASFKHDSAEEFKGVNERKSL